MREVNCGRCHNVVRHGRSRGLVIAFCNCLPRNTRQRLMEILKNVEAGIEMETDAQYTT